jgi:hypothetical protein
MQGRRIDEPPTEWEEGRCPFGPGDYWRDAKGDWRGFTPNGLLVWLRRHHVVEHEDGTITVAPGGGGQSNSILVSNGIGNLSWHGYIERGRWLEC